MAWGDPDIYANPEKFGIKIIGTVEFMWDYEHDLFTVWGDEDGRYGWAHSAGCSCYAPFEGMVLDDIEWGDVNSVTDAFENHLKHSYHSDEEAGKFRLHFMNIVTRMVSDGF